MLPCQCQMLGGCTAVPHLLQIVFSRPLAPTPLRLTITLPPAAAQQRGMFIQTQPTPNPTSLMFIPGEKVGGGLPGGLPRQWWLMCALVACRMSASALAAAAPGCHSTGRPPPAPPTAPRPPRPEQVLESGGSKSFTSAREAMASPLAKKLFHIDGVTQVGECTAKI